MDENISNLNGDGLEVKDSQTFSIKETKLIVIKNVPEDLFIRYRDFCRKYAQGNWTRGLQMMVDAGELIRLVNPIIEANEYKFAEVNARLESLENKTEEKKERKLKTFGGE